jgi:CRISPR/Cas system-associated exonuclease Cas4 (RecB family)
MNLNLGLGLFIFFNFFLFLPYLLLKKRRLSRELGIPKGWKLIYTDAQGEGRLLKTFLKGAILCGKPDWVYQNRSQALVIEDKQGAKPGELYLSHRMQLAAYFLLVEKEFGLRPYQGILRFRDGQTEVSYDPTLIPALGTILEEMRAILLRKTPARRNHSSRSRCRSCKFYERCNERL